MNANRREPAACTREFAFPAPELGSVWAVLQSAKELAGKLKPWTDADLSHTIRLLAIIADDDSVQVRNPRRVVEAFQNHGHLLCDHEVEMLRDWLVQLDRTKARAGD